MLFVKKTVYWYLLFQTFNNVFLFETKTLQTFIATAIGLKTVIRNTGQQSAVFTVHSLPHYPALVDSAYIKY